MKKLITLLLVSAFLFAVTIVPAGAATCLHDEVKIGTERRVTGGDANGCISYLFDKFQCNKCGAISYDNPRLMQQQNHVFYSTDLGHQPANKHRYMHRCYRCPYTDPYTVTCYGPPWQGGIDSVLPEIK